MYRRTLGTQTCCPYERLFALCLVEVVRGSEANTLQCTSHDCVRVTCKYRLFLSRVCYQLSGLIAALEVTGFLK